MEQNDLPTIHFHRLRAALALRASSIEAIARTANVTSRHVWFVVARQRRPSARLLDAMRSEVGEAGWLFVTGQTDTLRDEGGRPCPGVTPRRSLMGVDAGSNPARLTSHAQACGN